MGIAMNGSGFDKSSVEFRAPQGSMKSKDEEL